MTFTEEQFAQQLADVKKQLAELQSVNVDKLDRNRIELGKVMQERDAALAQVAELKKKVSDMQRWADETVALITQLVAALNKSNKYAGLNDIAMALLRR